MEGTLESDIWEGIWGCTWEEAGTAAGSAGRTSQLWVFRSCERVIDMSDTRHCGNLTNSGHTEFLMIIIETPFLLISFLI